MKHQRFSVEEMRDVILNARENVKRFYGESEIEDSIADMKARIERVKTLCPALLPIYELALLIYQDAAKKYRISENEPDGDDAGSVGAPRWCTYHNPATGYYRTSRG